VCLSASLPNHRSFSCQITIFVLAARGIYVIDSQPTKSRFSHFLIYQKNTYTTHLPPLLQTFRMHGGLKMHANDVHACVRASACMDVICGCTGPHPPAPPHTVPKGTRAHGTWDSRGTPRTPPFRFLPLQKMQAPTMAHPTAASFISISLFCPSTRSPGEECATQNLVMFFFGMFWSKV